MGIHYDYKSTRGAKAMEKQAKRDKKLAERRAKRDAKTKVKKEKFLFLSISNDLDSLLIKFTTKCIVNSWLLFHFG